MYGKQPVPPIQCTCHFLCRLFSGAISPRSGCLCGLIGGWFLGRWMGQWRVARSRKKYLRVLGDLIGCFGANSFISTSEFFIDDSMGKIGKGLTRQLFQRSAGQYQSLWWFWGIHVGESSQGGDPHDSVMTHDGQFGMLHSSTQTETGMCVCVLYTGSEACGIHVQFTRGAFGKELGRTSSDGCIERMPPPPAWARWSRWSPVHLWVFWG